MLNWLLRQDGRGGARSRAVLNFLGRGCAPVEQRAVRVLFRVLERRTPAWRSAAVWVRLRPARIAFLQDGNVRQYATSRRASHRPSASGVAQPASAAVLHKFKPATKPHGSCPPARVGGDFLRFSHEAPGARRTAGPSPASASPTTSGTSAPDNASRRASAPRGQAS